MTINPTTTPRVVSASPVFAVHICTIETLRPMHKGSYGKYLVTCNCGYTITSGLPSTAKRYARNHETGNNAANVRRDPDAECLAWL